MSELKHTPGPWAATPSDHPGATWGAVIAPGCTCCDHDKGRGDHEYYGGHLIAESIKTENRPLISAAPDLLAACELALKYFDECVMSCDPDEDEDEDGDLPEQAALRAAIAKAKGE